MLTENYHAWYYDKQKGECRGFTTTLAPCLSDWFTFESRTSALLSILTTGKVSKYI